MVVSEPSKTQSSSVHVWFTTEHGQVNIIHDKDYKNLSQSNDVRNAIFPTLKKIILLS